MKQLFRHSITAACLAAIFLFPLLGAEWHNYAFTDGPGAFHLMSSRADRPVVADAHELHHCPLCDYHLSNTLLPALNCVKGIQNILPAGLCISLRIPGAVPSLFSFDSRGPPLRF